MKTIWKWELPFPGAAIFGLDMPVGAWLIRVEAQHEKPCLWAVVDSKAPTEQRLFAIVGTGHPCPDELAEYVGSFHLLGGNFVGHLWAKVPEGEVPVNDGSTSQ